jgi:hypothetical protein
MGLNVPAGAREAHPQKETFILILLPGDGSAQPKPQRAGICGRTRVGQFISEKH